MHRVSNNTCGKSVEYNTYLWEKNYLIKSNLFVIQNRIISKI